MTRTFLYSKSETWYNIRIKYKLRKEDIPVKKETSKEMREYLFDAYNTECVDYCGRVWTVTKAVEFCSKLQSLDKDMLYALYVEAKKHRPE